MEKQCPMCAPCLINRILWTFVNPMQSKGRLEISLFIWKQYFFLLETYGQYSFAQNREHNLINTPLFDENGTCIQGLDGYQDSRAAK